MAIDNKDVLKFGSLELLANQVVEGFITGMHKSPFHGFSVEFAEHRLYNAGESTKNIDWKLYAKSDKLFVKKYEEETNLRCQIIIDTSKSMLYPKNSEGYSKVQFSALAAASLILMLKKQRDAVGLSLFNDHLYEHTENKSSNIHHKHLFDILSTIFDQEYNSNVEKTDVVNTLHEVAEKIHKRSLVIIFSDLLDGDENEGEWVLKNEELISAMQHLKHNKHEVILFHVNDKKNELFFEFDNRPYKFVDLESGEEIKLKSNEVKEEYVRRMKEFYKEIQVRCGQLNIDLVKADINEGLEHVLLSFLLKRSKLY